MNFTPGAEIKTRIARFQAALCKQDLDGALILLNSDMFYFTGTVQNSVLYVPAKGEPLLMVKKSLHRAQNESPLKNIIAIKSPKEIAGIINDQFANPVKLGLALDVLPVNLYNTYKKMFPHVVFSDVSPLIKDTRAIKSPYEIELIRNSLQVIDKAFSAVPDFLREGMLEVEAAALFEAEMRKRGYSNCCKMRAFNQELFFGNLCTGSSGAFPSFFDGPVGGMGVSPSQPQGAGWKPIQRNEVIYIDYTCVLQGYTGDQTRIFCIGELTPRLVKAYEDALFIEAEIIKAMKPGIPAEAPYLLAITLAGELGYKDYFMGYKENQAKFIGHGIGLELDEWPILAKGLTTPVKPGMTFALEPKFVFPEGAIGTESSFVMTEQGPEQLSVTPNGITYIK
ncbi:M24 family metallopeptidase [Sporomusa termitida]|uniref:Putative peptidase n=1 Tax=Sporomusa termitida TaxID=2377 RepID=A0A517E020_9FIRM|nr:Xaa-Pro peptidase family protein [Sporomusa termitida]QDR82953.1 putative peptidase [Sporomusa termitida]